MRTVLRWVLAFTRLLIDLVLALAVLAGGALYVLDDQDYRSALVWAAGKFLDARLQIGGPFAVHLGPETTLSAADVHLMARDGSYDIGVASFQTDVLLDSLLHGVIWIKDLTLAGVRLEATQSRNAGGFDYHGISIPAFVIEAIRLDNINVIYHQATPGETRTIDLQALVIDDVNDHGPLGIHGNGRVEDRPFSIEGQLDSLAQLVSSTQPYGVQIDLTSDTLTAHVEGTIARPLEGKGVDLRLGVVDSRISRTLRLWDAQAPELGSVSAHMQLRGNYDALRLEQIDAQLRRPDELELNVSGEVGDLATMDPLELQIDGRSTSPSVISWMLFDRSNRLKMLAVQGTLRSNRGQYRIENLHTQAQTRSGVGVTLDGSADIHESLSAGSPQPDGLNLAIDAPSTRALTVLDGPGGDTIPEFGRIKATGRLIPSLQSIGLEEVRLDIGGPGQIRATASGSGGIIPFSGMAGWSGFNLALDARAEKSTYLNRYLEKNLPELGVVQARMRVRGNLSRVSVESMQLTVGNAANPSLRANGSLRTGFTARSTTMDIRFDVATADLVATIFHPPPSTRLGRLQGDITASDLDGSWGLNKFTVISVQTPLFQFRASGALPNRDRGEARTQLQIDDLPALGKALGVDLSDLSHYRGQGSLSISRGQLDYTASNTLGSTTSRTVLTGTLSGDRPHLQGELDIPVLHLRDFRVHSQPTVSGTGDKQAKAVSGKYIFSRKSLDFSFLRRVDLDLKVRVPQVTGSTLHLRHVNASINLRDGVLRASPVKLEFEGGPAVVSLGIDARQKPRITLSVTGDDLSLGPALAEIQNEVPVEGYVNLNTDLRATGNSEHELVSSLDGKFGFGLENARVPRKYIDFLAIDVFGWAYNVAMHRDPYANLDCVMASFDIKDGVATSSLLAADGPDLAVAGTATLNLGAETIDMTLLPEQKGSLFSQLSPVHVKGPLRDPQVTALPIKAAITNLGSLALVPALPVVAIPAILGEKLWMTLKHHEHKDGGCARLTRKIIKRKDKDKDKDKFRFW